MDLTLVNSWGWFALCVISIEKVVTVVYVVVIVV